MEGAVDNSLSFYLKFPYVWFLIMQESCSSEDDEESYIPAAEVQEFRAQMRSVMEKRQELRETLKSRFAQLCVNTGNPPQKIWK